MRFLICFILALIASSSADAKDTCDVYRQLCPQCSPADLSYYRDAWPDLTSMDAYKDRYQEHRDDVAEAMSCYDVHDAYEYLALIESCGKADNVSSKGAAGLWQLMPYISRHYGLTVTAEQDDRLDASLSTHAAMKYLSKHIKTFDGDIRMVIAAYNAGGGNLLRSIEHKHDFVGVKACCPQAYALSRTVFAEILREYCPGEKK